MITKVKNTSSFFPHLIPFLILGFALIAGIQLPIVRNAYKDSDFFSYWLAGRDIALGINPYEASQWISDHYKYGATWISDPKFIYPLPLGILFVPLGLLPLEFASSIWIFLTIVSIFFSLNFVANKFDITSNLTKFNPNILGILIGLFFFRPFITVLYGGQLGGLILFIISLITYFFKHEKWFLSGLLLPILIYKPQIGLPFVGIIAMWLLARRKWNALLGIFITILVTLIISYVINPNWIREWLSVGGDKVISTYSRSVTIWGFSAIVCGFNTFCSQLVSSAFAGLMLTSGTALVISQKNELPEVIVGTSLCISLLITPYLLGNDLLLLLFPIVVMLYHFSRKLVTLLFLIITLLFIIFIPLNTYFDSEGINATLTAIVLIFFYYGFFKRAKILENIIGSFPK